MAYRKLASSQALSSSEKLYLSCRAYTFCESDGIPLVWAALKASVNRLSASSLRLEYLAFHGKGRYLSHGKNSTGWVPPRVMFRVSFGVNSSMNICVGASPSSPKTVRDITETMALICRSSDRWSGKAKVLTDDIHQRNRLLFLGGGSRMWRLPCEILGLLRSSSCADS